MRHLLLISILPLAIACGLPTATVPAPAAVAVSGPAAAVGAHISVPNSDTSVPKPAAAQATAPANQSTAKAEPKQYSAATATPAQKPLTTFALSSAGPHATIAPASENHGIALGQPLQIDANSIVLLVTNTTDQVMSFTATTTYRKGDHSVEFASAVADLLPKQSRPAVAAGGTPIPTGHDAVTVAVTHVQSAEATTPMGEIANHLTVGEPQPVANSTSVTATVSNNGPADQHVSLQSAYLQNDEMVAYGEGQATMLKPGETRSVTVSAITPVPMHTRVTVVARSIERQ